MFPTKKKTTKPQASWVFFIPNVSKLAEFVCKMYHKVKCDQYLNREIPRELQLLQQMMKGGINKRSFLVVCCSAEEHWSVVL